MALALCITRQLVLYKVWLEKNEEEEVVVPQEAAATNNAAFAQNDS